MAVATKNAKGRVSQVVSVVVDVDFPEDKLPAIFDALELELNGQKITLEVAQHLSESSIRVIRLVQLTDLKVGTEVDRYW